mmetsp:Transcript_42828/g.56599  ORF Transcript_42828/g.56599 Transcript_42828/m.56599 type:complete len:117 (+) Transcript_42828:654-1004(+)
MARPNNSMILNPGLTPEEKKFLLAEMPLTEPSFSTRFQRRYVSWIDFGKPDANQLIEESVSIKMNDDFFWSANSQGVRIGESNKKAFRFEVESQGVFDGDNLYTIFDTGATDIYIS